MRNHYEIKDALTGEIVQVACAAASDHGATWHDGETAPYRDMTLTSASPIDEWAEGACMGANRLISVTPLETVLPDGRPVVLNDGAVIEYWDGSHIVHQVVSFDAAKPHVFWAPNMFASFVAQIRDVMLKAGLRAELSALQRLGANGSVLTGSILLGEVDFGNGDKGKYFLSVSTSYDGSEPSAYRITTVREICANTHGFSCQEAERTGRKVSARNFGGTKLDEIKDSAVNVARWADGMIRRREKVARALRATPLPFSSQTFYRMLLEAGKSSKALKPSKDSGGIVMTDDIMRAIQGGGREAQSLQSDYGAVGRSLLATIVSRAAVEKQAGIDDVYDTAWGAVQGISAMSTYRGEECRGPFGQMADEFERLAIKEFSLTL